MNLRNVLWLAAAPALLAGVAACGATTTAGSAIGTTSSAAPATTSTSAAPDKPQGAKTPEAEVAGFVTDVLEAHYTKACMRNAAPAGMDVATACKNPEAIRTLTSLHDAWAKPGITLPPTSKVQVTGVTTNGDTATVHDTTITVDGHTLNSLMLIGATGDVGGFGMSLSLQKQNGQWYIGDMNMGTGEASPTS